MAERSVNEEGKWLSLPVLVLLHLGIHISSSHHLKEPNQCPSPKFRTAYPHLAQRSPSSMCSIIPKPSLCLLDSQDRTSIKCLKETARPGNNSIAIQSNNDECNSLLFRTLCPSLLGVAFFRSLLLSILPSRSDIRIGRRRTATGHCDYHGTSTMK